MAITTYTYSVTNNTLNGVVNNVKLLEEIQNSSDITISPLTVETVGDTLYIRFKDALPINQTTLLSTLLAQHNGELIETVDFQYVKILEQDPNVSRQTAGHFKSVGLTHTVLSGVGQVSHSDFTFPYPIEILAMNYVIDTNREKDVFDVLIAPNTVVGAITADVLTDATVLPVSPTVLGHMTLGKLVTLAGQELGYCVAIDKANSTITVENPLTADVAGGSFVEMTTEIVKGVELQGQAAVELGGNKIGGSFISANTVIRFIYHNNQGNAKTFSATLEFLYG